MIRKITYILSKQDKIRLVILFIGMFFNGIFDLIGVSAILPVVSLLTSPTIDGGKIYQILIDIINHIFDSPLRGKLVIILIVLFQ